MLQNTSRIRKARMEGDENDQEGKPVVRSLIRTTLELYRIYGVSVILRGLKGAVVYQSSQAVLLWLSNIILRGNHWGEHLARIIVPVLLAELHANWTLETVAYKLPRTQRHGPSRRFARWRVLAVPAISHIFSTWLLQSIPDWVSVPDLERIDSSTKDLRQIQWVTAKEVFGACAMLFVRLAIVLPTWMSLIMAEANLFRSDQLMLILSPLREQLTGSNFRHGIDDRTNYNAHLGTKGGAKLGRKAWLGLVEIHAKKCIVHLLLEWFTRLILAVMMPSHSRR